MAEGAAAEAEAMIAPAVQHSLNALVERYELAGKNDRVDRKTHPVAR